MNLNDLNKHEPQTIMQAFRIANKTAESTKNSKETIRAYDKVIDFCSHRVSCSLDNSLKTRTLLLWAYKNIGDAYFQEKNFSEAKLYFYKALNKATNLKEKISVLQRLSTVLVSAKMLADGDKIINIGEEVMRGLEKEELPLKERCDNVLALCQSLMALYKINRDDKNLKRIQALHAKTLEVAEKLKEN